MADDPSMPGWKSPTQPTGKDVGARRQWMQEDSPTRGSTKPWSRGFKIRLAAALLVVLGAIFIVVVVLPRSAQPAVLVLFGAPYDTNLTVAHNLYGWRGLQDLASLKGEAQSSWLFHRFDGPIRVQVEPRPDFTVNDWNKDWGALKEKTVVITLFFHGGADQSGPYLLLDDPRGDKKLLMSEVWDRLQQDDLRDKNKVLLLEPSQISSCWQRGLVPNEFIRELKKDFQKRQEAGTLPAHLFVFCANDVNQRSWASQKWRQTIFLHYIVEGLKGAADRSPQDMRVTLQELVDYVAERVPEWVRINREAEQNPILLGDASAMSDIELVKVDQPYQPAADEASEVPFQPEDFREVSDALASLDRSKSNAYAYAPHVCRQYLDTLLRLEQIIRAGDPTQARNKLQSSLRSLRDAMQLRPTPLNSLTTGLSMPGALGLREPWDAAEWKEKKQSLWTVKDPKAQEAKWKELLNWIEPIQDSNKETLLRMRVVNELIHELTEKPIDAKNLEATWSFVNRQYLTLGDVRPIEAHYLGMLNRDLPNPSPKAELLQRAVEARYLAEQVFAADKGETYDEIVYPWVQQLVDEADRHRQNGENQIISSVDEDQVAAGAEFAKALEKYKRAITIAGEIRQAVELRNRLLIELPYYSEWIVRSRSVKDRGKALERMERLWQNTHALIKSLEASEGTINQDHDQFYQQVQTIRGQFDEVQRHFDNQIQSISLSASLASQWQAIEDALAVPWLPKDRTALLNANQQISAKLNEQQIGPVPSEEEQQAKQMRELADREKRLAMAVVNVPTIAEGELANLAKYELQQFAKCNQAFQAGDKNPDPRQALAEMAESEKLARNLDGAAAGWLDLQSTRPCEEARRLRLHQFLRWQIERTLRDHWFELEDKKKPYYVKAAELMLKDARQLVRKADPVLDEQRQKSLDALASRVIAPEGLSIAADTQGNEHFITDKKEYELKWKVKSAAGVPPGQAVFWFESLKQNSAGRKLKPVPLDRVEYALNNPYFGVDQNNGVERASATLRGRYRGQFLDSPTELVFQSVPDTIVHRLPPSQPGFMVRAGEDVSLGTIAIILDASGSMTDDFDKNTSKSKFDAAVETLKKILAKVPVNTTVSVWIFGRTVPDSTGPWVRLPDVKWTSHSAGDLMDQVKSYKPKSGRSPIAKTMIASLEELKKSQGFRTMLVLTDGCDNGYETGNVEQLPSVVADKIVAAFDPVAEKSVDVHMVVFNGDAKTPAEAKTQKAEIERARAQFDFFVRSDRFTPVKNLQALEKELETALVPRLCFKDRREALAISDFKTPDQNWYKMSPGQYWPSIGKYRSEHSNCFEHSIFLESGDRLLTELSWDKGFALRRLIFADLPSFHDAPKKKVANDAWQVAVLGTEYNETRQDARMLVVMENLNSPPAKSGSQLKQKHPGFRWLEISPHDSAAGAAGTPCFTWFNDDRYPAPGLGLERSSWPKDRNLDPVAADIKFWYTDSKDLPSDATYDRKNGTAGVVTVDGREVKIEIDDLSTRKVRSGPESSQWEDRPCFVVRIQHDPKHPVWCRLQIDGKITGEEHRYYFQAGQHTAIFWGPSTNKPKEFTLQLTALNQFKREAKENSRYCEFSDVKLNKTGSRLALPNLKEPVTP